MSGKDDGVRVVRIRPSGSATQQRRAKGKERLVGAQFLPTEKEVDQKEPASTLVRVRYATGRTITLRAYTFARVSLSMSVYVARGDTEKAFEFARTVVDEIVERETALLRDEARSAVTLERPSDIQVQSLELWLDYGLTIPLGNMESAKADIGIAYPIGDAEELEAAVKELQAWCQAHISQERDRIVSRMQNKDKDKGL